MVPSVVHPHTQEFRALFTEHAGYLWSSLRRLGVAPGDLEDLTHDVFLHVHRHLPEYDAARPMRPWLFGFAFRIASQYRRLARRRYESPFEGIHAVHPDMLADEALELADDRKLVLEALDALDLDKRAVFVMAEIDEIAMSEIADTLEIPVNTGYSRLRLARLEFASAAKRLRARRGDK